MSIKNDLPDPITRTEHYLSKAATGEGETPTPITRTEQYLDAIAQGGGGGGFTPTPTQLEAINSGINASLVARTILAPITTPTEPVLLGVDETNSEAQFKLGTGLSVEGDTSPYTIKASGGMPIIQNNAGTPYQLNWDRQYYLHPANTNLRYLINDDIHGATDLHEIRIFQYPDTDNVTITFETSGKMYFWDGSQSKSYTLRANTGVGVERPDIVEFSIVNMATDTTSSITNIRTYIDIAERRLAYE